MVINIITLKLLFIFNVTLTFILKVVNIYLQNISLIGFDKYRITVNNFQVKIYT